MTTTTTRDQVTSRNLLDFLRKGLPFAHGLLLTTVPRGDLQVAQPTNGSEGFLRAYAENLAADDRLTWQTLSRQQVLRPEDCWAGDEFLQTAYYRQVLQPSGLRYALTAPVAGPVLDGYPGVVHLFRTADQGNFTPAEADQLADLVRKFDDAQAQSRGTRRTGCSPMAVQFDRPPVHLIVMDAGQKIVFPTDAEASLDAGLRQQMADYGRTYLQGLNGHPSAAERAQLPDSHGDHWVFRVVAHRRYPALGDGAFTFFCLQPECGEWGGVRPQDFGADPELSRLIPALKFMQAEFRRGPSLSEISGTVSLSPFHFHRRFTELLGLTPKQYMLACQIHEAKAELLSGEKELAQIAKDCGFAHQSHFTSRFKQAAGLTPTRWRRMAQQRAKAANN